MELFLTAYLSIGLIYGIYVCISTWSSWGGGLMPILNGIVSGILWFPFVVWVLLE